MRLWPVPLVALAFLPAQSAQVSVSGRVTNRNGLAVPGALVSLRREGSTMTVTVYADDAGRYQADVY